MLPPKKKEERKLLGNLTSTMLLLIKWENLLAETAKITLLRKIFYSLN